jgi:lipoate---protein ligase
MQYFDGTFLTPPKALAFEEVLLEACDQEELESWRGGWLHFWEASKPFVVVGYSNRLETEVNGDACLQDGIPVLRRCSGGGTVLQGPGCLNYSLVLSAEAVPEIANLSTTNRFVMERHRTAMEKVLDGKVEVMGHTDLTLEGFKFSGNAQKRARKTVLFHGTFLLEEFPVGLMERYLRMPSVRPDYRRERTHRDFVKGLRLGRESIKQALVEAWGAAPGTMPSLDREMRPMVEKYNSREWIEKF